MRISWKTLLAVSLLSLLLIGGSQLVRSPMAQAQPPARPPTQAPGLVVSPPITPAVSRPVRTLPVLQPQPLAQPGQEVNPRQPGSLNDVVDSAPERDPLRTRSATRRAPDLTALLLSFDGLTRQDGGGRVPPDTIGDVGPNHYVQMVNVAFAIYDKQGTRLTGPTPIGALWRGSPFEAACDGAYGDPVVLYDALADRWLLSQFGLPNAREAPWYECIAISQTPDPTGSYHLYAFAITDAFPDYPKLGVWPAAYYMATNDGPPAVGVFAFDRARMLLGQPATFQKFTHQGNFMLPADLDGPTLPPAGAPGYFYTPMDDTFWPAQGFPGADRIEIWTFTVDFATPANSSFQQVQTIPLAPYNFEDPFGANFITQPGTSQRLDQIGGWPMWRLQYRNFGFYEAMVGNFTVDVTGNDLASIRWFELRKTATDWSLFQEGTHSPDDTHRWIGSIALDQSGNMALGYSASSSTLFPSIRYATRLANDPPGTLRDEATLHAGTAAQTNSHRWGDYSSMNVDPVDDCTFWYTNEYLTDSTAGWRTRVGAFRIPTCGTGILFTKSVTPSLAAAGQTITYTIIAENNNSFPLTNALISDTLPADLTFLGPVTLNPPQPGATLAQNPADLPTLASGITLTAGTAITLTLPVQVNPGTVGDVINTATITSSEVLTPTESQAMIFVGPVLTLDKQASSTLIAPNQVLTYTIRLANSGGGAATGAVVSDTLPADLTFLGPVTLDPPQPTAIIAQNAADLPTLVSNLTIPAQSLITITLPVRTNPALTEGTVFTNTAIITSTELPTPISDSVLTRIALPRLTVQKAADLLFPIAGQTMTYTMNIGNTGLVAATGIVISDTLPAGLSLAGPVTLRPPQPGATLAQNAGDLPILASGVTLATLANASLLVPVTVDAGLEPGTQIDNTVAVTSTELPTPLISTISITIDLPRTTLLFEDFATATGSTPPPGWTNRIFNGTRGVDVWRFNNPGRRDIVPPLIAPVAIFDSDRFSDNGRPENVALVSPAFDAATATSVILEFDQYFEGDGGAIFVEAFNGTAWQTVYSTTEVTPFPDHQRIDITAQVAGVANAQVRFRWTGDWSWWWIIDNVRIAAAQATPLDTLTLSGPQVGFIGIPYTFTTTISPTNATQPISYTWTPEPTSGQGTPSATYIWDTPGSQTVRVSATNPAGQVVSATATIRLTPITLTLVSDQASIIAGETVRFTATVNPLVTPFDHVLFVFGDGSPPIVTPLPIPRTGQFIATHTYTRTGLFTTRATFVSSAYGGNLATATTRIAVQPGPPARVDVVAANASLPADGRSTTVINATMRDAFGNPIPEQPITFSTTAGAVNPTSAPTAADGTATTTLTAAALPATATVTASAGPVRGTVRVAFIQVLPLDSITLSGPPSGFIGVPYTFTTTISPTDAAQPISYTWQPEPASGQGTASASYIWDTVETKTIRVRATNPAGRVVTDSTTITLTPPNLALVSSQPTPTVGEVIIFTATIDPLITPYDHVAFDFGDNRPPFETALPLSGTTQFTATHVYTRSGSATVAATFVSGRYGGAVVSATTSLTVQPRTVPIGTLTATSSTPTLLGNPTIFTATVNPDTNATFTWDFGDGTTGAGSTPTHTYTSTGRYTVTVTATNALGARTATTIVEVGNVTPRDGGVIVIGQGTRTITLTFAPRTVPDAIVISATLAVSPSGTLPPNIFPLRILRILAFDPAGAPLDLQLSIPYTITFRYSDAELAARGLSEDDLRLFVLGANEEYTEVLPAGFALAATSATLDPVANLVTVSTTEITEFILGLQGRNVITTLYLPSVNK